MDWRQLILGRESIPELTQDSVHVWRISTANGSHDLAQFSEVLSAEELARAARFHFERDRRSFVVCRGLLRQLLAEYTGDRPANIRFCYGMHGKPALAQPTRPDLHFNVSHSGEIALLAFALGREVGVDVERMRENVDFAGLAKHSFSGAERESVLARSPETRANIFYEYWSCKESCIKADGRGLSAGLDQFTIVAGSDGSDWRQVVSAGTGTISPAMRIHVLTPIEGYAAAVAAVGPVWTVMQICISNGVHGAEGGLRPA